MNILLNIRNLLFAMMITIFLTILFSLLFALFYSVLPLRTPILPIFANFSLGFAVFCGAIFLSRNTPFFKIKNILYLSAIIFVTVLLCSFFFGSLSQGFLVNKIILIVSASFLGEVLGRI